MIPRLKPTPSEAISGMIINHAGEIEKEYGIYID